MVVNNRLVRKAAAVLIGVATIANVAYYDAEIVSRLIRERQTFDVGGSCGKMPIAIE